MGVPDGEIALILLHGRGEGLLGNLEEGRVESSPEGDGILDQVVVLVHQIRIELRPSAQLLLDGGDPREQLLPALLAVGEDELVVEPVQVFPGGPELDASGAEETMPPGDPAALDPTETEGQDLLAVEGHEPSDRAPEADRRVVPVHVLREDQPVKHPKEKIREQSLRGGPRLPAKSKGVLHALHLPHLEVFHGDTLAAGEAHRRLRGTAVLVEGLGPEGPLGGLQQVLLALREAPDDQRQTPGGPVDGDPLVAQPHRLQLLPGEPLHLGDAEGDETGGQLLHADLEQQIPVHRTDSFLWNLPFRGYPMAARCSA